MTIVPSGIKSPGSQSPPPFFDFSMQDTSKLKPLINSTEEPSFLEKRSEEKENAPNTPVKERRLFIYSSSPLVESPEKYAKACNNIRRNGYVLNSLREPCEIVPMVKDGRPVMGAFSVLYIPKSGTNRICLEKPNEEIVIKILREKHLRRAPEFIETSLRQYGFLKNFFASEESPPIIPIYNEHQAGFEGYTVVKKVVKTFESAPWSETSKFSELSPQHKGFYGSITKLIGASQALKREGLSPLDLKWNNLGLDDDGTLKLIDYANIPFIFGNLDDCYARRLSGGNSEIQRKLEEIENDSF